MSNIKIQRARTSQPPPSFRRPCSQKDKHQSPVADDILQQTKPCEVSESHVQYGLVHCCLRFAMQRDNTRNVRATSNSAQFSQKFYFNSHWRVDHSVPRYCLLIARAFTGSALHVQQRASSPGRPVSWQAGGEFLSTTRKQVSNTSANSRLARKRLFEPNQWSKFTFFAQAKCLWA